VIAIVISYFLANCFYEIACEKGFDARKYFWISFLLGIVGYLLVIALPDRKTERAYEKSSYTRNQPTQTSYSRWCCPKCGTLNPYDVIRCKCGEPK